MYPDHLLRHISNALRQTLEFCLEFFCCNMFVDTCRIQFRFFRRFRSVAMIYWVTTLVTLTSTKRMALRTILRRPRSTRNIQVKANNAAQMIIQTVPGKSRKSLPRRILNVCIVISHCKLVKTTESMCVSVDMCRHTNVILVEKFSPQRRRWWPISGSIPVKNHMFALNVAEVSHRWET